jgi:hypothetical protein
MATLEEKKAFYASRNVTAETMRVALGHGDQFRSMTEEEFEKYLEMCSDPDELLAREEYASDENNYMWKCGRVQEYPKLDPQLDGIFHALKAIRDQGIDLGTAGNAYVDTILEVKEKYPKPE